MVTLAVNAPPTDDIVSKSPMSLSKSGMDCTLVETDTPAPTSPTHTIITAQEAPVEDPSSTSGEEGALSPEAGEVDANGVDDDTTSNSDSDDDEDSLKNVLKKYKEAKKYFTQSNGITYVPNSQWYEYRAYCVGCHLYVASDVPDVGGETRKSTCKTIPQQLPHQPSIQDEHSEKRTERYYLPFRFRIVNILLRAAMEEVVGPCYMNCDHVAPYRAIVPYYDGFRELLHQKEQEFSRLAMIYPDDPAVKRTHSWLPERFARYVKGRLSSVHPPDDPVTDGTYPGGRYDVLSARTLLDGLRALIHFLDCDLRDLVRAREQIVKRTLERIPFPYLWHLYHPGQVIITKKPKYQAYRVLQICGGRRPAGLGKSVAASFMKSSNLVIDCFCLDFDGKLIRALPKTISIRPYDGELPITALEAYPLDFEPKVRDILVQRGRKFVDLAKVSHRRYNGLNLRESDFNKYEEVSLTYLSLNFRLD